MSDDKNEKGLKRVYVHGPHCGCGQHSLHDTSDEKSHVRELPDFPTEIIFKAVFRNVPFVHESIAQICAEAGLNVAISERASRNSNFVSYTVTAVFPSEAMLNMICGRIGELEGFMMMF